MENQNGAAIKIQSNFKVLITRLSERDDIPPEADTYARDMEYYVTELDEHQKAAERLRDLASFLINRGISEKDPEVLLLKELSVELRQS